MKKAKEGEDEQAYESTIRAMEAEKAGKLSDATAAWGKVKERLAETSDKRKAEWTWVADKRYKEAKDVPTAFAKIASDYRQFRSNELPWNFDPADVKKLVTLAYRLEMFDDKLKAREKWQDVIKETEGKSDQVVWYLLASQQAGLPTAAKIDDPMADRVKKVTAYLNKTAILEEEAPKSDLRLVKFRECRNRCRDLIELYSDESDIRIRDVVAGAKALLEKLNKQVGDKS